MRVSAGEFIRRFLIHILPDRFMKIRHYGLLGNRNKTEKLGLCKRLTHTPAIECLKISVEELLLKLTGKDIRICSHCGTGNMIRALALGKSPPLVAVISYETTFAVLRGGGSCILIVVFSVVCVW